MPQPSNMQTGHTWGVTAQEEEPTINDQGKPSSLHTVHFQTNTGHKSSITLPTEHFNAKNVAKAINAKAHEIVTVHAMTSTNAPRDE